MFGVRLGCRGRHPSEVRQHILLLLEALPVGGEGRPLYGGAVLCPQPLPALVRGDAHNRNIVRKDGEIE